MTALALAAIGFSVHSGRADTVLASKHNLSASGPGDVRATIETEVCVFCHTPHNATPQTPLWSRPLSQATYTPYNSSTIKAAIGQPTGSSKLCLSCHDGTVALGMLTTRSTPIEMRGGVTTMPAGRTRIGTDLSDDHPISFTYDNALAGANGQLKDPGSLKDKVKLDHAGQMQCTSCHDPHDNQFGKFLVKQNIAGALCVTCHDMRNWDNSAHKLSTRTWNGSGIDPWPNSSQNTVANNACDNCHSTHNAGIKDRLLTHTDEEQNCTVCHNGNVAAKNIEAEFAKLSVHPIRSTTAIHDPTEDPLNATRHVECSDCHNPHAANSTPATVPNASGALAGLLGINQDGALIQPLTKEYELCFRCHADSVSRGSARIPRQVSQTNTRLDFAPNNGSFHPVITVGKNLNVPSLLPPQTPTSRMYCTDCHNSDSSPGAGGTGANGPHGSAFPPILERQLALENGQAETSGTYALCYKCHNRSSILSDQSFPHRIHVVDNQTSCVTCHDPHGVQGSTHLINFNTLYASPSANGRLEFVDNGTFRGNCSVSCHLGENRKIDHQATSYTGGTAAGPLQAPLRQQRTPSRPRR